MECNTSDNVNTTSTFKPTMIDCNLSLQCSETNLVTQNVYCINADSFSERDEKIINIATINSRQTDTSKIQIDGNNASKLSILDLLSSTDQALCLKKRGYSYIRKLSDTVQGELFEAESFELVSNVVIKKTEKLLHEKRISIEGDTRIIVQEDIVKEAFIMHYLTAQNNIITDAVPKFIDFFESLDAYYLVMAKAGNMTVAEFAAHAHLFIDEKKMTVKHWRKIVKYIFYQLSVIIYWLHKCMKCCHLDLHLSNIMISNGRFIENKNGMITIDPNFKIRLIDFGLSEVFKCSTPITDNSNDDDTDNEYNKNAFKCNKFGIVEKQHLLAPKVFNEEIYDAKKADIWSCGVILYQLLTNIDPHKCHNIRDEQSIMELLEYDGKRKYVNYKIINLLSKMMNINEIQRANCSDVLEHEWLNLYYNKQKNVIHKKSRFQFLKNQSSSKKMNKFPFYEI
eukprot:107749_1